MNNISEEILQEFYGEFVDVFYTIQNDLEKKVLQNIYKIFDVKFIKKHSIMV